MEHNEEVQTMDNTNRVFITTSDHFGASSDLSGAMDSTSEENERPPVHFQVASDTEDESDSENFDQLMMMMTSPSSNFGVFYADQVRCPLCERWKKRFTCKECLLKGDFILSNPNKVPPPVLLMEGTTKASNSNAAWKELR